ncbi:GNAT family N-acetyltransferase [Mucilaginibacter sp. PPCGB 2223]|uniref:GNAT family N-acetyltransferase n=1 Tax=Mucilaginibacter sp. PPCGB 2223 TaxID=1886027 RepID=UPI000824BB10|nr:GNAT family N-acetyltransferase [Mucilaginibacter sp. PPCGB 2223]OCX50970.1 GNAT family N-acetyltransferase [Mucilaginibacter sp. PPCGB 2223]
MIIRLATTTDIPAIMQVINAVVPVMQAAGNFQWDSAYPNPEAFEKDIALKQLWVAVIDGTIAGITAITTDQSPEYAHVGWDINETAIVTHRLAVHPKFGGRGIAAALLKQAEIVAAERGIPILRIDTNTQNQATQALFPKMGYVFAGEIGLSFRPGLSFYCYEKRI